MGRLARALIQQSRPPDLDQLASRSDVAELVDFNSGSYGPDLEIKSVDENP